MEAVSHVGFLDFLFSSFDSWSNLIVTIGVLTGPAAFLALALIPLIMERDFGKVSDRTWKISWSLWVVLSLLAFVKIGSEIAKDRAWKSGLYESEVVIEEFTLVGMNPPKHFRVTLESPRLKAATYSVSKHCSRWQENVIGTRTNLTYAVYKNRFDPNYYKIEFRTSLSSTYCG